MNAVWVILLCGVLTVSATPGCDEEEINKCGMGTEIRNTFPTDASELKEQCSERLPKLSCVKDFLKRCPEINEIVGDFFIAADEFENRLCDGDLHDPYLKNARCFADEFLEKQKSCTEKFEEITPKNICHLENCVKSAVRDTCGEEAYVFVEEMYRVTNKLIKDFDSCSSSNKLFGSIFIMLFAYSMYLIMKAE